jgi:hypothetical protein
MPNTEESTIESSKQTEPARNGQPKRATTRNKTRSSRRKSRAGGSTATLGFPKHAISKCLRIPQAILDQNAGNPCTDKEATKFLGLVYNGSLAVEISSGIKYGLLERPAAGTVKPTDLTRRIVRPQKPTDKRDAMRQAILNAPGISDAYKHYRGENLPDLPFLKNTARESFHVPEDKIEGFVSVFIETLKDSELLEDVGGKQRVLDVTHTADAEATNASANDHLKKVSKGISVQSTDTCFVVMPFAEPLGTYYASVYEPAIKKAGLTPVRADNEIYGTGKIIDQIWSAISSAKVLLAELTKRNPNVLYELGLAHALRKPVVLVSSNEEDVPFDVKHVRVIYYDVNDPFWGSKLIDKVAENILSALKNPNEAILFGDGQPS